MAWQQPRPWKQPPTARQAPRDQRPITLQGAEGKSVGINASDRCPQQLFVPPGGATRCSLALAPRPPCSRPCPWMAGLQARRLQGSESPQATTAPPEVRTAKAVRVVLTCCTVWAKTSAGARPTRLPSFGQGEVVPGCHIPGQRGGQHHTTIRGDQHHRAFLLYHLPEDGMEGVILGGPRTC